MTLGGLLSDGMSQQATAAAYVLVLVLAQVLTYRLKSWAPKGSGNDLRSVEIKMPADLKRFFAQG